MWYFAVILEETLQLSGKCSIFVVQLFRNTLPEVTNCDIYECK